jgi:putative transposase
MGIEEVVIAPWSPWQNPYVERVIGSIRRELLDQVIVLNERHLMRLLHAYVDYYHALSNSSSAGHGCTYPSPRATARTRPCARGPGSGWLLHHHYERIAA